MNSVVTILFLLAACLSLTTICAPNQRADSFVSSVNVHVRSHESVRASSEISMTMGESNAVNSVNAAAGNSRFYAALSSQQHVQSSQASAYSAKPSAISNGQAASSTPAFPASTGSASVSLGAGNANIGAIAAGGKTPAQAAPSVGPPPSITGIPKSQPESSSPRTSSSQDSLPMPPGTGNTGGTSAGSGLQPYPSQASPFSNSTTPVEGSSIGSNGTSGSGTGCPPQQTVTITPEIVTLPAQTVTVTASQETATITITSQPSTQTITTTVTITARPAPILPTNANSPGTGQDVTPPVIPGPGQTSFQAPATDQNMASIPGSYQGSASSNVPDLSASTAGQVPPIETSGNTQGSGPDASQLTNQTSLIPPQPSPSPTSPPTVPNGEPTANPLPANTPLPPQISPTGSANPFSVPADQASVPNSVPLYQPSPAATPIISLNLSSILGTHSPKTGTGLWTAAAPSGQIPGPYQNATGGVKPTPPSAGGTAPVVPNPTNGPTAPAQTAGTLYQINGGFGYASAFPVSALFRGPIPNDPSSTKQNGTPAGPSTNASTVQTATLSRYSSGPVCSNHISTQNITADFTTIPPKTPPPFLHQSLNYTSFTLSSGPQPHLLTLPASIPKTLTLLRPHKSFSLHSLTLSCVPGPDTPPPENADCAILVNGVGTSGASGIYLTGRLVIKSEEGGTVGEGVEGKRFGFEKTWKGLSTMNFVAERGGVGMGVALWGVEYTVEGVC